MSDPSSWFIEQLALKTSAPKMFFTIDGSDYSERVTKWPKFNRTATQLKSVSLKIPLANVDGALNQYYENTYTIPSSATLEIGFEVNNFPSDDRLLARWNFDEGSGHNLSDVTGNGFDATESSSFDWSWVTSGIAGHSIDFPVTSDYHFTFPDGLVEVGDDSFAVSIWCNPNSAGTETAPRMFGIKSSVGSVGINFGFLFGKFAAKIAFNNGINIQYAQTDVSTYDRNALYHVVYNVASQQIQNIIVDKVDITITYSGTNWTAIPVSHIGGESVVNKGWEGPLDEIRVYSGNLTLDEAIALNDHPTAVPSEKLKLYSGFLKDVGYADKICNLKLEDRLADFHTKVVGESNNPVQFPSENPALSAWTLCTCYGELSSIESNSNPDIDYDTWDLWSNVFSENGTVTETNYKGEKVKEALSRLAIYTDSKIFVNGEGKLVFKGFTEVSSIDITLDQEILKAKVDVESKRLVNKQIINWDYSVDSDYWASNVFDQASTSVNTFGLHENILEDESIWYSNSVSALGQAQRLTTILQTPPKRFLINTGLAPLHMQIGDTVRLVDSFFNVTSASGWAVIKQTIDLNAGIVQLEVDEAIVAGAFYLDVSSLDGDDLLL